MMRYYKCPFRVQYSNYAYSPKVNPYGYIEPLPDYFHKLDLDEEPNDAEIMVKLDKINVNEEPQYLTMKPLGFEDEGLLSGMSRAPQDVNGVIDLIGQRASQEINEILRIGMDRKLLDYLIRAMVQYIDKNFVRYQGSVQRKVEMALFDMKRDLGWNFDIMRIYNVSFATENRLLDKIARTAVQSLRPEKTMQTTMPMTR